MCCVHLLLCVCVFLTGISNHEGKERFGENAQIYITLCPQSHQKIYKFMSFLQLFFE